MSRPPGTLRGGTIGGVAILELDFDPADSITAGVEGEPGARTFFLEAHQGLRSCTLMVEKTQLQELGTQLEQLLSSTRPGASPEPSTAPGDPPGWRVGSIQLALDEEARQCTLLLGERPALEEEEDVEEEANGPESDLRAVRIVASLAQMRALAGRALRVVQGGRPVCPLCHLPMDREGHVCPASNGHHPV